MLPTPDVLDCCEEAFLFDLACEDVWLCSSDESTAMDTDLHANCGASSSFEAAQHHRVAAVEWPTVRLLLRHAFENCAGLSSSHAIDNYVVTTLLDVKPLTASAVVAARERLVDRRLPTRDLVRMVSRAGPLIPGALSTLKLLFESLLIVEKAVAAVVVAERRDRHVVRTSEDGAWRSLVARLQRAEREGMYTRVLLQQMTVQQTVLDAFHGSAIEGTRSRLLDTTVVEGNALDGRPSAAVAGEVSSLDHVVGAPLRSAQAGLDLLCDAVHSAAHSLSSSSWCREPMQRAVAQYKDRLDTRVGSVTAGVTAARASVATLRRMRAGRRLRSSSDTKSCADVFGGSAVARALFVSLAALSDATRCMEDDNASLVAATGGSAVRRGSSSASSSSRSSRAAATTSTTTASTFITFPAFDYFAESCDVYRPSASMDVRWGLFARYADPVVQRRSSGGRDEALRTDRWFDSHRMSVDGFGGFVEDWTRCADEDGDAASRGQLCSSFMEDCVVPRWATASLLAATDHNDSVKLHR